MPQLIIIPHLLWYLLTLTTDDIFSDSCSTKVDSATMKKLSGCTVKLESAGVLNFFRKWALTYALREVTDTAVSYLNAQLPQILAPIVEKHDICGYLNPLKKAWIIHFYFSKSNVLVEWKDNYTNNNQWIKKYNYL